MATLPLRGFFFTFTGFLASGYVPDFIALNSWAPRIDVSGHDFAELGMVGIYAVRVSSFVAIVRHNRQPQVAEWWIAIIGLSFAAILALCGGFLEAPYAAAHGYKYCFNTDGNEVYVKQPLPCPPAPPSNNR